MVFDPSLSCVPSSQAPRPYITAVLAMSADGKIADAKRSAARFPSAADKAHLERQVASADATLFGASTLRAYHTTLSVSSPGLLAQRQQQDKPKQPIQIVCSATGNLDSQWPFFQQPIPRWLIATPEGLQYWKDGLDRQTSSLERSKLESKPYTDQKLYPDQQLFEHVLIAERPFRWPKLMQMLYTGTSSLSAKTSRRPVKQLLVMGGGELVASLLADDLIDELYLTICPLLIGGKTAPTPVGGLGFTLPRTPRLSLKSSRVEGDEVFLHYLVDRTI